MPMRLARETMELRGSRTCEARALSRCARRPCGVARAWWKTYWNRAEALSERKERPTARDEKSGSEYLEGRGKGERKQR